VNGNLTNIKEKLQTFYFLVRVLFCKRPLAQEKPQRHYCHFCMLGVKKQTKNFLSNVFTQFP